MSTLEKALLWSLRIGIFALLYTPFIIAQDAFFPFITGKNFYFRIVIELLAGLWVMLAILRPEFRPRKNPIFIAFGVFTIALIFATIFSVDPYHSFWSNFERMEGLITHLHLFVLFVVITHTFLSEREWFWFFHASLGVSVLFGVIGILQAFGPYSEETFRLLRTIGYVDIVGAAKPYARFGNSIYLAVFLMFHIFLSGIFFYWVRNNWARVGYVLAFIIQIWAFIVASSRGAFVGLAAGIGFIALFSIFYSRKKIVRIGGAGAIVLLGALFSVIVWFPESSIVRNIEIFDRLHSVASIEALRDDPRVLLWGIALDAFQERPILGWGMENFIIPYANYYDPLMYGNEPWFDRTHNMPLQWLVDTGVIGFTAYVSIFVMVGYVLFRLLKEKKIDVFFAIFIAGFFIAYIIQNSFVFDNVGTYLIIIPALAFIAYSYNTHIQGGPIRDIRRNPTPLQYTMGSVAIVLSIVAVFALNSRNIEASERMIIALASFAQGRSPQEIQSAFQAVFDLETFARAEAAERLGVSVAQINPSSHAGDLEFLNLINYSIDQLEQERVWQPEVIQYDLFLGKLYLNRGIVMNEVPPKAEEAYLRAIDRAPNYVQSHIALTEFYLLTGRNDEAITSINRAFDLAIGARNVDLFYQVLLAHAFAGDYVGATTIVDRFVDFAIEDELRNDGHAESLRTLTGRLINLPGDPQEKIILLDRLNEQWDVGPLSLGLVYMHASIGNAEAAKQFANEAVSLDPAIQSDIDIVFNEFGIR